MIAQVVSLWDLYDLNSGLVSPSPELFLISLGVWTPLFPVALLPKSLTFMPKDIKRVAMRLTSLWTAQEAIVFSPIAFL